MLNLPREVLGALAASLSCQPRLSTPPFSTSKSRLYIICISWITTYECIYVHTPYASKPSFLHYHLASHQQEGTSLKRGCAPNHVGGRVSATPSHYPQRGSMLYIYIHIYTCIPTTHPSHSGHTIGYHLFPWIAAGGGGHHFGSSELHTPFPSTPRFPTCPKESTG